MIIESNADLREVMDKGTSKARSEWERLARFEAYYRGRHAPPYVPPTATREYKALLSRCTTNLTRLVIHTMVQRLVVDGYKASPTDIDNAAPWDWWQSNGLDARQKALYDEVAKHGYAACLVLPETFRVETDDRDGPVIWPVSAREWYLEMQSWADDAPLYGLKRDRLRDDTWWVVDDERIFKVRTNPRGPELLVIEDEDGTGRHGMGVCPLVPFRNQFELTHAPTGEVEPVIPVQDRLNQTVFDLLVATTYSSAPQKWIAGMAVPTDDAGQPVIDLKAFAKAVWMSDDPSTKFGSLPEANLANIVHAIESCLRVYGLLSQTPPHYLLGDLVNLSAEALLAADTSLAKKIGERQALLGESWEATLRLAARAAGDTDAADDAASQVVWRDTEPRSIAQQVDALSKLAQSLAVPVEALWEKIPGVTRTDLELWRAMQRRDQLRAAAEQAALAAQTEAATPVPATGVNGQGAPVSRQVAGAPGATSKAVSGTPGAPNTRVGATRP